MFVRRCEPSCLSLLYSHIYFCTFLLLNASGIFPANVFSLVLEWCQNIFIFFLFPIVVLYMLTNCYLYLCICGGGGWKCTSQPWLPKPQAFFLGGGGGGLKRGGKLKGIKVHLTPSCKICKPDLLYLHVLTLLRNRPAAAAQRKTSLM